MKPKRLGRPVVRARLPRVLYPVVDGAAVYEYEIPAYAGWPASSGLLTLERDPNGQTVITVSHVDDPELRVVGPILEVSH